MSIAEYTYIHAPTATEVYVRRQGDRITDVYAYRDAHFLRPKGWKGVRVATEEAAEIEARHFEKGRKAGAARFLKWVPKKNPLFVHASHNGAAYGFIRDLGFTSYNDDPEEL